MSGVACIIEYSEVWATRRCVGTPEYALCIKATIRNPAVADAIEQQDDATRETVDEIGLRAEFTKREQLYLRELLLVTIAGLPLEPDA